MNTVTITNVATIPELDAFHRDTCGATTTRLYIDPDGRKAYVRQDDNDNSTPEAVYHDRILAYTLTPRPDEKALSEYLNGDAGQTLLATICDGHAIEWNGHNNVGKLTETARDAVSELRADIEALPGSSWELWAVDEWISETPAGLTPDTTDEELAVMAQDYETIATTDNVVLASGVLEYMTSLRTTMRHEQEA